VAVADDGGIGAILYLGEASEIFELSRNSTRTLQELSRNFPGTFQELSRNFPGTFQELSRNFLRTFQELSRKYVFSQLLPDSYVVGIATPN
jgi:septation ring formation regulator EzrA